MTKTTSDQGGERRAFEALWELYARVGDAHENYGRNHEKTVEARATFHAALKRALSAAQPVAQEAILKEVVGCFEAALAEGLQETLAETKDERLKDLVERRLMHAMTAALAAPKPSQGAESLIDYVAVDAVAHRHGLDKGKFRRAFLEAMEQPSNHFATPHPPVSAEAGKGVADAWLFTCKKPGTVMVYATIDPNDANHWPVDQWKSVVREDLFKRPSESVAVSAAPMPQAVGGTFTMQEALTKLIEVYDAMGGPRGPARIVAETVLAAPMPQPEGETSGCMANEAAYGEAGNPVIDELTDFVVSRWHAEVKNRPLVNKNRRPLDDAWRQILRHLGVDDRARLGPTHDELLEGSE